MVMAFPPPSPPSPPLLSGTDLIPDLNCTLGGIAGCEKLVNNQQIVVGCALGPASFRLHFDELVFVAEPLRISVAVILWVGTAYRCTPSQCGTGWCSRCAWASYPSASSLCCGVSSPSMCCDRQVARLLYKLLRVASPPACLHTCLRCSLCTACAHMHNLLCALSRYIAVIMLGFVNDGS